MADATIEMPKMRHDGHYFIDGMVSRQCHDSQSLYKLSNESPPYIPRLDDKQLAGPHSTGRSFLRSVLKKTMIDS